MGKVPVSDLKVGARFTSDVKHTSGKLLIPMGTEVKEQHIQLLKTWGIRTVSTNQEMNGPSEASRRRTQSSEPVDSIFALANMDNEVMKYISSTAKKLVAKGSSSELL